MKQIVFIGDCDKTDLLFYVCKLLGMEHEVLLADLTRSGRYRHTYPKMEMEAEIHQYDNFDIAESVPDITGISELTASNAYDYVIVDIDDPFKIGGLASLNDFYLVTSYDNHSIQENKVLLEALVRELSKDRLVTMTKVICEVEHTFTEDFLVQQYDHLPIEWREPLIYVPDERDLSRKINNQFSGTVQLKRLSPEYKLVIKSIVESILGIEAKQAHALWKQAERSK
ncbi:hypothetical protein [Paenibacillus azoreducens]|uniref:Uncharacterized protein n=1 Tax=Paenibacillus azoreducens TaxID=116718 RepID=A0A919YL16_9BACL|nr:hypothetical protein [Paenibacillus azoreducens]GIO51473.1 hypothetical protein J34TS1_62380 [Paenibacillus azoreducens]